MNTRLIPQEALNAERKYYLNKLIRDRKKMKKIKKQLQLFPFFKFYTFS